MPKTAIPAKPISVPSPARRALLAGAASAAASALLPAAAAAAPQDFRLAALEREFEAALAACAAAQRHYDDCERRFFAACPDPPPMLTRDGLLEHFPAKWEPVRRRKCDQAKNLAQLLSNDWSWLKARDLRRLLQDRERRALWKAARAAVPVAKAYEAKIRRLQRAAGLAEAEAAHVAAMDCLHALSGRAAAIPAHSLAALALKARVVRRWAAPEWWRDAGQAERLAAQVLDAVIALGKKAA